MTCLSLPEILREKLRSFFSLFLACDRWLLGAILAGILLGAQGFTWGRYDCLNLDAMAFRSIFVKERPPFHPGDFCKPPLYTYIGHFFGRIPATVLSSPFLLASKEKHDAAFFQIRLSLMRIFNLALFACSIALSYYLLLNTFGITPARFFSWLLATSAGFIPYQIYLTADLALTFFFLLSLFLAFSVSRSPTNLLSFFAGLTVGLATATKYNGLAAAIALPLAHLLAPDPNGPFGFLKRRSTWLSAIATPIGFLIANPYAIIDYKKFSEDFYYNYVTTPVYGGQTEGAGYSQFFLLFDEIYGIPASLLLLAFLLIGSFFFFKNFRLSDSSKLCLLASAIFAFYTWKIGSFPRMTTRFVLPVAPLVLFLAAPGFCLLYSQKILRPLLSSLFVLLVAYNLVCAFYIGDLFRHDPRMTLLPTLSTEAINSSGKLVAEASKSLPAIDLLTEKKVSVKKMPKGLKRAENFDRLFAENETMQSLKDRWKPEVDKNWFSQDQRSRRNPDWVIWCSIDLEDSVKEHYDALFLPDSGYQLISDHSSPPLPVWAYPQKPDFLINRTSFWKKIPPSKDS